MDAARHPFRGGRATPRGLALAAALVSLAMHALVLWAFLVAPVPSTPSSPRPEAVEVILVRARHGTARPEPAGGSSVDPPAAIATPAAALPVASGTGDRGPGDAQGEGAGPGPASPWRVAPSRFYDSARQGDRLDCSVANDGRVWRSRERYCQEARGEGPVSPSPASQMPARPPAAGAASE